MFVVAFDRSAEMSSLRRTFLTYSAVGLAALAVIAVVAWFVVGRLLRPVRLLRDTTRRITESDLSERIAVTGTDDLSDLARTVNAMLDRLERRVRVAARAARRRRPRAAHAADDRPRAPRAAGRRRPRRRARHAGARARRARPDAAAGRRPHDARHRRPARLRAVAPTDVGRLTDDVLEKARGLGDRRWVVAARADVTVELDPQRITQAWLQLLANAVRVLRRRVDRVASAARWRTTGCCCGCATRGPASRPTRRTRIFERFHRGQRRDRRRDGAGLGLPIVAAIAAAHHGPCASSSPGYGRARRGLRAGPAGASTSWTSRRPDPHRAGGAAMTQILIAEDEERIASFVAKGLRAEGFADQRGATGGRRCRRWPRPASSTCWCSTSGCRTWTASRCCAGCAAAGSTVAGHHPHGAHSVTDTVAGLESGADDYMAKPFRFEELLARVRLRLRAHTAGRR